MAEAFREIPPGGSRLGHPEHGVDEQPVLLGRDAGVAGLSGQEIPNPLPVLILDLMASHGRPSRSPTPGIPLPVLLKTSRYCPHGLVLCHGSIFGFVGRVKHDANPGGIRHLVVFHTTYKTRRFPRDRALAAILTTQFAYLVQDFRTNDHL